jgi:ATP-dependent exoDNAse (exonuclease V) alpha subunit
MEKKPVFHIGMITRGKGELPSAVAAGAYVLGKTWTSAYDGHTYDYSDKCGEVVYTHVLAPEGAPEWVYQPFTFVHAVEYSEKVKNAQLFRHMYFTLPPEFTREQHIALLHEYVKEVFVSAGMIAMLAIHHTESQQHAHLLLTTRLLLPDGTWAPKALHEPILRKNGKQAIGKDGKPKRKKIHTTDWNRQDNGEKWRRMYATFANKQYARLGFDTRIDHRSPKRQGLTQLSPVYMNPAEYLAEQQGEQTEVGDLNRWIQKENILRANYEQRKEVIDKLFDHYLKKMKQLGPRTQWRSPQVRATQQFFSDLHSIEDQFDGKKAATGASSLQPSKGHHASPAQRKRGLSGEKE